MTLEELYKGIKVEDYYLGKVTQVFRSNSIAKIENTSVIDDRKKLTAAFNPNTINYFVIIESTWEFVSIISF